MKPVTHGAYSGGMYGTDDGDGGRDENKPGEPPASETESSDGADDAAVEATAPPPPNISEMKPVTHGAYGGGMYGTDDGGGGGKKKPGDPPASETQSADGADAAVGTTAPAQNSSGDRDIDITGQSYIQ